MLGCRLVWDIGVVLNRLLRSLGFVLFRGARGLRTLVIWLVRTWMVTRGLLDVVT